MTTYAEPTLFDSPHAEPVDAQTASLLALISADRIHTDDAATVTAAIVRVAQEHDGQVSMNHVRPLLRNEHGCVVAPPVIGATVNALKRAGVLVEIGWDITEGSTTGNDGKPQRRYRLTHAP